MRTAQFSILWAELQGDHCFPQAEHKPLENSSEAQDWGRKRQDPLSPLTPWSELGQQSKGLAFLFW